jgi:hypothetical protein
MTPNGYYFPTPLDTLSKQHYLTRFDGQWLWGYFPWNGSVIVVGFDGSRPDSLENIRENSVTDLLTPEEARRHWAERIGWGFSVVSPNECDTKTATHRGVVYGLALKFRAARTANAKGLMQDLMHEFYSVKQNPVNRKHETPNTLYALEA